MRVSIVIPNYNGEKELFKNLPQVFAMAKGAETIVVDDASVDGSVKMLRKYFPQVTVIQRDKNEGFASTVNDGVKHATGDLILLLNHDVIPSVDLLNHLTYHFNDPKIFAVGCLEESKEGTKIVFRGRGVGKFKMGFLSHSRGEVNKNNTLWVTGGAAMFNKKLWQRLGGMDTIYNPFYWEDIDLSYRAQKAGYKIVFEPKGIVVHEHEQGAIRKLYSEEKIKTIAYKNQILFVWLNITDMSYLMKHFAYLSYHLIKAIISADLSFIKGFLLAITLFPKVIIHRWRNAKLSHKSDKEILADYLA